MNCSTFKNKLYDYIEGNMTYDMKEAMETHMKHCDGCREIYEEEKGIDDCFREAFNVNTGNFVSSRPSIMKNIDRNRYSKNPINKLRYNLKRYRINYLASAAVLVIAFFTAPYVANMNRSKSAPESIANTEINSAQMAKDAPQKRSFMQGAGSNADVAKSESGDNTIKMAEAPSAELKMTKDARYIPKFIKSSADSKADNKFGTPWKASPSGKLQASVDGKGPSAGEEGIAQILINDLQSNSKWLLVLTENERQFTPKFVEWIDEENLLVIVGYSQGTVSLGGEVFIVNINTGSTDLVYGVTSNREEVVSFKKGNNVLDLQVVVYTDDNMSQYKTEQRIIDFKRN
jgi:hypothetical protein